MQEFGIAGKNIFDVTGKVVIVTGAGTGLGESYAQAFGEMGATVVCAGRTQSTLERAAAAIRKNGGEAIGLSVDVTDPNAIRHFMKQVQAQTGGVDVLVNNAGAEIVEDFLSVTPEHFDAIIGVNLKGAYFMAQAAAEAMKERGGKMINIGSLGSYIGLAESSVYCSSKGAIVQLTKTMAIELAKYNIQVNAIAPGYFVTPMTQQFYDDPEHRAWIESRIPAGRWGTGKDLAGPALFLASSASDYVTGQVVIVDGGWLAG